MDYWVVLIVSLLLSAGAGIYVKIVFDKYDPYRVRCGMTAESFASKMLRDCAVNGISVRRVSGSLTDYYYDAGKTLSLSESTYGKTSISALAVASHEAGHAVQYGCGYTPVKLRQALVPAVNIGSYGGIILALIGSFFYGSVAYAMVDLGIILYSLSFVFTLITLPVEFNASGRAIRYAEGTGLFSDDELKGMRKVLTAAALTYVAAMITSLLNLLRFISVFGGRRRK